MRIAGMRHPRNPRTTESTVDIEQVVRQPPAAKRRRARDAFAPTGRPGTVSWVTEKFTATGNGIGRIAGAGRARNALQRARRRDTGRFHHGRQIAALGLATAPAMNDPGDAPRRRAPKRGPKLCTLRDGRSEYNRRGVGVALRVD